jgi:hypothetical protein
VIIALLFVLISTASVVFLSNRTGTMIENNNTASEEQNMMNVVRANRNIQAGEIADAIKFEVVAVPAELIPSGALSSVMQLQNKRVSVEISQKEILLQSDLVDAGDWYEDGDRLIEHTFQDGTIPLTVEVGSIVDIKLFRVKSQDNVVITKAVVIGKAEQTLSFYLNETEQENIKEASTEGQLFLVQYLDKSQGASIVTYKPSYSQGNKAMEMKASYNFEDRNMSGGE